MAMRRRGDTPPYHFMATAMRRYGGMPPYRLGQQVRQFCASIVQTRLDGSNRDVQRGGNLLNGLVGEIAQYDYLPERLREGADGVRNLIACIWRFRRHSRDLLRQVFRRSHWDFLYAAAAVVHSMEVEHDRVQPCEEVSSGIKEAYLLYRLVECAKNKFLGVVVVGTKQDSGCIKAIAVFGNQPFRSSFPVFSYLLPDIHLCFGLRVHPLCKGLLQ